MNKKRKNDIAKKKIMDNMCENISVILLEMGLYPCTDQFDKMFYRLMSEIEEEIKVRVIKNIRNVIDQ